MSVFFSYLCGKEREKGKGKMGKAGLERFSFKKIGYGSYLVAYTTRRGDYYKAIIDDMTLIDSTLNAEYARMRDITALFDEIVSSGTHYAKDGSIIVR